MYAKLGDLEDFLNKKYLFSKKALKIMNFAPCNAHTTPSFKNCNILKFADIINVESCILKLVSTAHSSNNQLEIVYLLQVITQLDLGENQLSIQPLLCGIISRQVT